MPLGEKERQDREVFQRNMKSRMETFKSGRHKRHKKDRSLKKVLVRHKWHSCTLIGCRVPAG